VQSDIIKDKNLNDKFDENVATVEINTHSLLKLIRSPHPSKSCRRSPHSIGISGLLMPGNSLLDFLFELFFAPADILTVVK
jgi:hypothetical protein